MTRRVLLGIFAVLLMASSGEAATTYYVRDGASGSGSTWTDALDDIPTSPLANSTYYLAEGTYSGRTISANGVTLKKCPSSSVKIDACQGVSGWLNTYGDGQAIINGTITVNADNLTVDGQTRNESNWGDASAYGMRVIQGFYQGFGGHAPQNLLAQYLALGNIAEPGNVESAMVDNAVYIMPGTSSNLTFSRIYAHHFYMGLYLMAATGVVIEYSYYKFGFGKEWLQTYSSLTNVTIRYNILHDACQGNATPDGGRCTLVISGEFGTTSGFEIYGNVIFSTGIGVRGEMSDNLVYVNGNFYNNTIAGFNNPAAGNINLGTGSCRNNLSYDMDSGVSYSCSGGSSNNAVASGSGVFVNYAGGNFRLTGATVSGYTLSAPYNYDMDGTTRGASGVWDVGAYEYSSGGAPPTGTITLSVRSIFWWVLLPLAAFAGTIAAVSSGLRWFARLGVPDAGMGGVGSGEVRGPVRPLTPGAVQSAGGTGRGALPPPDGLAADVEVLLATADDPIVR